MPKVLIAGNADLFPVLRDTVIWNRDVERVVASSADTALHVARAFVPSLVVVDGSNPLAAASLVRRLRMHPGTRRSSIVVASDTAGQREEGDLLGAGANLVLPAHADPARWNAVLENLLSVPRRVRLRFPASLRAGTEGQLIEAEALNVSLSGVLVEVPSPLCVGTEVEVHLRLPGGGGEQRAEGSVVRTVDGTPPRLGIRFLRFVGEAETRIQALIASVPPQKTFGRYESLGLLGEGAMGRVYRAFDPATQRVVAVKTLRPELLLRGDAAESLQRFHREVVAAARLDHPNIVTVFDVGDDYFVMELLEGLTLEAVLRQRGRLEPAAACAVLLPVARALDHAHGLGTIHRDIKPANIMLANDGRPIVMDFGVAHLMSGAITASGQLLGSPAYLAPEQINGAAATSHSDLFSLAVTAYEALTARMPFDGATLAEFLFAVVELPPRPPSTMLPPLPTAYDGIFERALAKDPARRFPTAAAFVDALQSGLGG
jgi:tRNA A-37 threonylcarbamoyl transferase component Bud32